MSVNNLSSLSTAPTSGTVIPGLNVSIEGSPDQYFSASLLANPNDPTGLFLTLSESGYISIDATILPGENGNPDILKAQLSQMKGKFQQNFYYSLDLTDWTTLNGFLLTIEVYGYDAQKKYQGKFKFTKSGTKPPE